MATSRILDRWFYVGMAAAALLTLFAGFARTFYLRPAALPPLAPVVVVHGILQTGWVLLFSVQATLVARGHTGFHRRLGLAGAGLAPLTVDAARNAAILTSRVLPPMST